MIGPVERDVQIVTGRNLIRIFLLPENPDIQKFKFSDMDKVKPHREL